MYPQSSSFSKAAKTAKDSLPRAPRCSPRPPTHTSPSPPHARAPLTAPARGGSFPSKQKSLVAEVTSTPGPGAYFKPLPLTPQKPSSRYGMMGPAPSRGPGSKLDKGALLAMLMAGAGKPRDGSQTARPDLEERSARRLPWGSFDAAAQRTGHAATAACAPPSRDAATEARNAQLRIELHTTKN
jgi:hypothetical protein